MIKLNKFKIGIPKRNRKHVHFGLSYVDGWFTPNIMLLRAITAPTPLFKREDVQICPMPEPMSKIFYIDYINMLKPLNNALGCVKIPDA